MDLLSALNKALNENAHKNLTDQSKNDLQLKREKLSSELTSIDDELFDLEKKYGEFKRPKVVVKETIDSDFQVEHESKSSSPVVI
jgi:hypothetical protein